MHVMTLTESAISELSAQERLSLIAALWDSLADAETPLPEAQRAELERRLAIFDQDAIEAVGWEKLKAELRARAP
jgi:putative addiction module component (TIGR02574 family)